MAIQDLIESLEELVGLHNQLLELAHEKKDLIISNDLEQLNGVVNRESRLLRRVQEAEARRLEAMNRYLIGKGYRPNPQITVSDVLKLVFRAEDKERLQQAQKQLLVVMEQLKAANELNQQLIQQSLQFIQFSLDLLAGPEEDEAVYQHPGHAQATARRSGLFDTRA